MAFCGGGAVDLALDGKQDIDAGHGLYADRRLVEPRQLEEVCVWAQQAISTIGPGS